MARQKGHISEPGVRQCPVCGKEFLVGGRGRPPRDTVYCSWKCSRQDRYRRGMVAKTLSPRSIAYLAGFIDGEGSIMLYRRGVRCFLRLAVASCDLFILEWIQEQTGVGANITKHTQETAKHRLAYAWTCNSEAAESVIRQLLPDLKIKRLQAELALAFMGELRKPGRRADTAWQENYRKWMQALNHSYRRR